MTSAAVYEVLPVRELLAVMVAAVALAVAAVLIPGAGLQDERAGLAQQLRYQTPGARTSPSLANH